MVTGDLYEFGRFRLDAESRILFEGADRILLAPKALDLLTVLVEKQGTTVSRQDLLATVWPDSVVEEGTLSSHVSLLRKTLGSKLIETIPKRGYRFAGAVTVARRNTGRAERILLAVLPVENLDGSRKYDSFSDGLTEELISELGRLNPSRLGVIARTSAMTYKSTEKTIAQIGSELSVSHVLEASARRSGARIRITAQLIQVCDQTHVWSGTYEASVEDILTLQTRIARAVAEETLIELRVEEDRRRVVPAAYEAFLRGRYHWHRRSEADLRASLRCFEESSRHDPSYAQAWAGMADSYLTLTDHGLLSPREGSALARRVVDVALQIDPNLAAAHVARGHAAFHEFDWEGAETGFRRGLDLNPNYSIGHHYYANYLAAMGQLDLAIAAAEQARQLDPVSPAAQSNLSTILWLAGRYDRSIEEARKAVELAPDFAGGHEDLGRCFEQIGELDAAEKAYQQANSMSHDSPGTLACLAYVFGRSGRRAEAQSILKKLQAESGSSYVSPFSIAVVHLALGELDRAFDCLEQAYEERSSALPFLNVNPRFESLRNEPRFLQLIQRLALKAPPLVATRSERA